MNYNREKNKENEEVIEQQQIVSKGIYFSFNYFFFEMN